MHAWYFPRTKSVSMTLTLTFIHEICLRKRVKCAPAFRVFWGKKTDEVLTSAQFAEGGWVWEEWMLRQEGREIRLEFQRAWGS